MKTKKSKLVEQLNTYRTYSVVEELRHAEREFGELISSRWDVVSSNPNLQKKALAGAKRLKELRVMLHKRRFLTTTIQ